MVKTPRRENLNEDQNTFTAPQPQAQSQKDKTSHRVYSENKLMKLYKTYYKIIRPG